MNSMTKKLICAILTAFIIVQTTIVVSYESKLEIANSKLKEIELAEKQRNEKVKKIKEQIKKISNLRNDSRLERLADAILIYSEQYNIKEKRILSIIYVESKFDKYAVNKKTRCVGYGQIRETVHKLPKGDAKFDEYIQVAKICDVYSRFGKLTKHNTVKTLNAYNGRGIYCSDNSNGSYANAVLQIEQRITI